MLELASVLEPNGIPEVLFTTTAVRARIREIFGVEEFAEDQVSDAVRNLRRLSLVEVDRTATHREVRVHALVQRATRETLTNDQLAPLAYAAADALSEIWPKIERDAV